jgi:acyl-CoA thioesterase FadM
MSCVRGTIIDEHASCLPFRHGWSTILKPDWRLPMHATTAALPDTSSRTEPWLTFRHTFTVTLKDSNAYGNTYFARHFEWQGICRERWFHECIASDMLQHQGVFITKHAEQDYVEETFPFDQVECEMNVTAVRRCSFWLEFRFFAKGRLAARGRQQIVFADHARHISPLPEHVLHEVRRYVRRPHLAA